LPYSFFPGTVLRADEGRNHFKRFFDIGKHALDFDLAGASGTFNRVRHEHLQGNSLSKESNSNFTIVYELLPKGKVLTVPNNATAHTRVPLYNVLLLGTWEDKDPNKHDVLRNASSELGRIVIQGDKVLTEHHNSGYGNYSELQEQ
jgi:hypothetical protein